MIREAQTTGRHSSVSGSGGKRILLFDLYHTGHHVEYLAYLIRYWHDRLMAGELHVAIPGEAVESLEKLNVLPPGRASGITVHVLRTDVSTRAPGVRALVRNDREHGRHLKQTIQLVRPDHCVLMYFDHAQISLAFDLRFKTPVSISGIYFRPSFHYSALGRGPSGMRNWITDRRKQAVLSLALRNPHFRYLFALDPFILDYLPGGRTHVRGVWLPDPVPSTPADLSAHTFRAFHNVEPERTLMSLFGVIDARKGVADLARAIVRLPRGHQKRLALAIFGPQDKSDPDIETSIRAIQSTTAVQTVVEDRFVQHGEVQSLLEASDVVVLPYKNHVGSSNVLVRAARAGRPVIGSRYGTLGIQIDRNRLGTALDTADSRAFSEAITAFLERPEKMPFDAASSAAFADSNTDLHFAATIFDSITVDQ